IVAVTAGAAGTAACGDDDGTGPPSPSPTGEATLGGAITGTRTLSRDTTYTIQGFVDVLPGARLIVPGGTLLLSDLETRGSIITSRCEGGQPSGQLIVQGTASAPVHFRPEGSGPFLRGAAGGIILHGCAPINLPGGSGVSEGSNEPFGGTNANDSSGEIRYLTIEFGGVRITPDNEINGLTMSGVGSATVVDHVQTHFIADDGFEWFGGTVNGSFLVASGNDDDNLDCDNGWTGTVQFFFALQDRNLGNRGAECDNDANGSDNQPATTPRVFNATFVGAGVQQANNEVNDGLYLRRNTSGLYRNLIVTNFGNVGLVFDGGGVWTKVQSGALSVDNALFFNNRALASPGAGDANPILVNVNRRVSGAYSLDEVAAAFAGETLIFADPQFRSVNFDNPINGTQPDPRPQTGSPALVPANAAVPSGPGVDASATFLGAFSTTNWLDGWTVWNTN
ncbi:MAG: hypothetical protein ACRDPR_16815, partial [Nocardioidaceae bacterium]